VECETLDRISRSGNGRFGVGPTSGGACAAGHADLVAASDARDGQPSESVAADKTGTVFISLALLGRPLKFAPGSSDYEIFGSIPDWTGQGAGLLGLAVEARGNGYGDA
jgi:hypothetical protein